MNRPQAAPLRLHGYWRSSAAYRVRIGLNLKQLRYESTTHDLRRNEQGEAGYRAIAPHGLVPAIETPEGVVIESLAILEWLEEEAPTPPLLPARPLDRAVVRAMGALVACDVHPLNNLRVLRHLRDELGASPDQVEAWARRWIVEGFNALERLVERHGGAWAFGDSATLADCCLIPQLYSARRFSVDLAPFPRLLGVEERARASPSFAAAHPERQPDAD